MEVPSGERLGGKDTGLGESNGSLLLAPGDNFKIHLWLTASSCGVDVISRYWSKSAFFKEVGHFKCKF